MDPQLAKMVVASPEFRFASHAHATGACPWLRWRPGAVARPRTAKLSSYVLLTRAGRPALQRGCGRHVFICFCAQVVVVDSPHLQKGTLAVADTCHVLLRSCDARELMACSIKC